MSYYFDRCVAATYSREQCKREASNKFDIYARVPLCTHHLDVITVSALLPLREQLAESREYIDSIELMHDLRNQEQVEAHRAELSKSSRVYFLRNGKYIKVGYTATGTMSRLETIKKSGGVIIPRGMDFTRTTLIGDMPGDMKDERAIHKRFAAIRVAGEWFEATPELTEYINSNLEKAAA